MRHPSSSKAMKSGSPIRSSVVEGHTKFPQKASAPEPRPVPVRSVVVGTAGHIDHGKTALVLALTGIDADRLPEEKTRGITIDLGFAFMELAGPDGGSLQVSIIDVPGHHAFVRNMLAGAGGVDAVMLVVAADEGVKAQTREHLQICQLLGIQHGLIVLTKQDAVTSDRLLAVKAEVADLVEGSFLAHAPVCVVSARTGAGIDALKRDLAELLSQIPGRTADHVARLPVDRAFSVKGFGTVVTGTLQSGKLSVGQSLSLQPANRAVRVRGVQVHGASRPDAEAPNRVALNLVGVDLGEVERGDTLVPANTLLPTTALDAEIQTLGSLLRHRQRIRVHAFAAETLATVLLYPEEGTAVPAASQLIRLRLARPMLLLPGDHLVLRQPSPAQTLGGGLVLDAHPIERLRKAITARWLQQLHSASTQDVVVLRAQRHGVQGISLHRLVAETGWTTETLQKIVSSLVDRSRLVADPGNGCFLTSGALEDAGQRVELELRKAKEQGIAKAALLSRTGLSDWVLEKVATKVLSGLVATTQGDKLLLRSFLEPSSSDQATQNPALSELERTYREAGLASPLVTEVGDTLQLPAAKLRVLITQLLRSGTLIRLGSDALLVHREPVEQLVADLRKRQDRTLDVATFKAITGLTRKHAIPLLEYLDGARVTRSMGQVRLIL